MKSDSCGRVQESARGDVSFSLFAQKTENPSHCFDSSWVKCCVYIMAST